MRELLSSPRLRRRTLWAGLFFAIAAAIAVVVVAIPRGGRDFSDEPAPDRAGPDPVIAQPKPLRMTPEIRREVNATLVPFVRHAVARERPEAAWDLVTPALRAGTTRAQWRRGDIPVYPYPARPEEATGWHVLEAFEDDLLISLLVHARPETRQGAIAFQIELKRIGRGEKGRWLVDSLIPERAYPAATRPTRPQRTTTAPAPADPLSGRLGRGWLLIPLALLSLIVLVPVTVALISWRRGVRAERAYERRRASAGGPPAGS